MASVERAATALDAARAAFLDADALSTVTNQDLVELLDLTAALTRVVDAQRVRLAGAIAARSHDSDEDSIHRLLGSRHAREAVGKAFGLRSRDAAELLTMAAATTTSASLTGEPIPMRFPRVAKALDRGALSLAQARAIVGTLSPAVPRADFEQLAWAEGCLVDEATDPDRRLAPELLVTQAQAYVAVLDPDGVLPNSERQRAMRSLRMRRLPDGMWELIMRCTPETAAAIKAVLDASTAPRVSVRFKDTPIGDDDTEDESADADGVDTQDKSADAGSDDGTQEDSQVEAVGRTRGDAGVEAGDRVGAEGEPGAEGRASAEGATEGDARETGDANAAANPVIADDRSPEQKRHDALVAIVEGHAASGAAPVAGGEVPRLVLTGTIEAFGAYLHGIDSADRTLTVEHTGDQVPIETADRLLCNGVVQRAVVDAKGHVLDLGRVARTFNRAQRRALAAQYRGCATPGCGFPVAWTEAHHVQWWEHGGPTDVANGILLCSHCHHEVHAGRLLVVGSPGAWRVVPQLRPADRYARNPRTGTSLLPTGARADAVRSTAAADAAPSLAVKLPETAAADAPPSLSVKLPDAAADGPPSLAVELPEAADGALTPSVDRRAAPRPRRRPGQVERRLRRRAGVERRCRAQSLAIDVIRPVSQRLVLRQ